MLHTTAACMHVLHHAPFRGRKSSLAEGLKRTEAHASNKAQHNHSSYTNAISQAAATKLEKKKFPPYVNFHLIHLSKRSHFL
mmetsp:Transcript_4817/g.10239  ORF Transcript_4817/g.10239 Transcript_4817/m.10239 type:complete len:82 (-) Transcript_4817:13-258(-)